MYGCGGALRRAESTVFLPLPPAPASRRVSPESALSRRGGGGSKSRPASGNAKKKRQNAAP
eukprot:4572894-Prymnesium_polylepis.1